MPDQDFYSVLGVARNASDEEIRRAFRRKAMEFHPDRNKSAGAEEKFKEVNEAYQVLSDSKKRAQYDRFGRAGVGGPGPGPGAGQPFDGFDVFGGFGDIFDSFFGGASRAGPQPRRGGDLRQRVVLSFEEAVFGIEKQVEVDRVELCQHCSGAGNEPGSSVDTCTGCRGSGQVRRSQRSVFGQFTQVVGCPTCQGRGSVISTPCTSCRGAGRERRRRKIAVQVPAGVDDGMQVRLSGEGDVGTDGGGTGNLYVQVDVQEHQFFRREGPDIVYNLGINVAEAALGVAKDIPTLDGADEELKLPQGTQPGSEFRIKGKGVPHLNSGRRGDLRVLVDVRVPGSLDQRQKELLEELAASFNGERPKSRGGSGRRSRNRNGKRAEAPADDGGPSEDQQDKGLFDRIKDAF